MSDVDGRRIYIHEASFSSLAMESANLAERIMMAMSSFTAVKAAYGFLQDLVSMDELSDSDAETVLECIGGGYGPITQLMHCLEAKPIGKKKAERARLLETDEAIVASCYFSGYFTFATSERAAKLMFADTNEIADIRKEYTSADITLIKGRSLWLLGHNQSQELIGKMEIRRIRSKVIEGCKQRIENCIQSNELPKSDRFCEILMRAIEEGALSRF